MERHRKIGGESLRNRDVLNEDRISDLPEALLVRILSLLPTYEVIRTSVLSKRWKSIWKMMPNLKFDSCELKKFPEDVCSSLILHKAPVLDSLKLRIRYQCKSSEIGLLIPIAFSRKLRKLVLILEEDTVKFPGVVFRCNNTLQILKLMGTIHVDLTSPVCLNSLKELHIYDVTFKDQESFSNLLCGCPRLQDLVVRLDYFVPYTFTIAVPSLQRLSLEIYYFIPEEGGSYVINAPSLKYLSINLFESLESCLIENAPELVEAKILEVSDAVNVNILESLTSAKRLSLCSSSLKIKYLASKIFNQLLSLELQTNLEEWWNLLTLMLNNSPKLQILKLIDIYRLHFDSDKPVPIAPKWNQPKCVPECLLFHLETFVWTSYQWQRKNEKELATYILKNARHLKKATLYTLPTKKLEKRRKMLNQLANEVRASNSCHLVFKFYKPEYIHTDPDLDMGVDE